MSSEHDVRVVRLGDIRKHENADSLGITEVDGRPCIVRLGEWSPGDLAVYVPIDSLCPIADERFAFLARGHSTTADGRARVRAARLRGVFSMGLLVRPDADMMEGDEVRERMEIGVWEPSIPTTGAGAEPDPGFLPYYDIESARKYGRLFQPDEEVVVTEKIHGANARYTYHQGRMWCASRGQFKLRDPADLWWGVAERMGLEERLARVCPGVAIFGEVYGQVQDLKYGVTGARFVAFDALDIASRRWLDYEAFCDLARRLEIETAPVLYRGAWGSFDGASLAEGPSVLAARRGATHIREGWVAKPMVDRSDGTLGRVIVKRHGEGFLTRKGG